jgi:hypothetical protein
MTPCAGNSVPKFFYGSKDEKSLQNKCIHYNGNVYQAMGLKQSKSWEIEICIFSLKDISLSHPKYSLFHV